MAALKQVPVTARVSGHGSEVAGSWRISMKYASHKSVLLAFICLFTLTVEADASPDEVFNIINERLTYMEDVALFKAHRHLPVEDVEREKLVVAETIISAQNSGIDLTHLESFIRAQMSVAKAVQYRHRADFLSNTPLRQPSDLQETVRPLLLRLNDRLIEQLAMYLESCGSFNADQYNEFEKAITVKYVTTSDKQLMFRALQEVAMMSED